MARIRSRLPRCEAETAFYLRQEPPDRITPRKQIADRPEVRAADHRRIDQEGTIGGDRAANPLRVGRVADARQVDAAARVTADAAVFRPRERLDRGAPVPLDALRRRVALFVMV